MLLSIGQLAKSTRESVKTLRYWTDLGILDTVRADNGYRYFQTTMQERVNFIRNAQALGFSLNEIKDILALRQDGTRPCDHVRDELRKHLENVQLRIRNLEQLAYALNKHLSWAEDNTELICDTEGCIYLIQKQPLIP